MDKGLESHDREELGGFLQELVLNVERLEDAETLIGILKDLKDGGETAQTTASEAKDGRPDRRRYDIFKLCPDRIERIGFVRGADNAMRMLPHLNALGDALYFLHHFDGT